ncbi:hypothetical protein NCC49_003638 [Naganishia albida]|nr:hypothetical protein NCC49_003638 [Naganishia albida]
MSDPTYGRYLIPTQHVETILDASPEIITRQRRVFFDPHERPSSPTRIIQGEDVAVTADELKEVQANAEWIYYKIWEMKDEFLEDKRGKGVDVVYVHGYREYGQVGRYAFQCQEMLKAGFRIIIPDMPGHGRSTGAHAHLPNARSLPDAIFTVLQDLRAITSPPARKTFLTGTSMGGLAVLYAATVADKLDKQTKEKLPSIDGAFAMCPLLDVPDRPNAVVTAIGKLLVKVAGKDWPLTGCLSDCIHDDERVPAEFKADPMNYTGKLRIATGIAFLHAFTETVDNAGFTKTPICILHGDADRTTSHKASMTYVDNVASEDKSIKIYEGYQHVMVKASRSYTIAGKAEDADLDKNAAVMNEWKEWLLQRV